MIEIRPKAFLSTALLLILSLGLMTLLEHHQEWKRLQRQYYRQEQITGEQIAIKKIVPSLTNEPELCLTCHLGIEEISPSHPVSAFGCVICHGGDGRYVNKQAAHRGLIGGRNPSDLRVVEQGCGGRGELAGKCHSNRPDWEANHILRVKKSLQATYAGGIHLVRFSLGLDTISQAQYGIANIMEDCIHSNSGLSFLHSYVVSDSSFTDPGNAPRPAAPIYDRHSILAVQSLSQPRHL